MKKLTKNIFKCIGLIAAFLTTSTTIAAPIERGVWEHIILGNRGFGPGHGAVSITHDSAGGFVVKMEAIGYSSNCIWQPDGLCTVSSSQVDSKQHLIKNWNLLFGNRNPNASLVLADTAKKVNTYIPLSIGRPRWVSSDTLEFKATYRRKLSGNLQSLFDAVVQQGSNAVIANHMPLGVFDVAHLLNIENSFGVPEGHLTAGLQYKLSKQVKVEKCKGASGDVWYSHDCKADKKALKREVRVAQAAMTPMASQLAEALSVTTDFRNTSDPIVGPTCPTTLDLTDSLKAQAWVIDQVNGISSTITPKLTMSSIPVNTGTTLSADQIKVIARGYVIPCEASVDTSKITGNPKNVQNIMNVFHDAAVTNNLTGDVTGEKTWNDLMSQVGGAEGTSINTSSLSYKNYLLAAARMPFFCAEKGVYSDEKTACSRELAATFAHGAQETGAHSTTMSVPAWKQAFYFLREATCYDYTNNRDAITTKEDGTKVWSCANYNNSVCPSYMNCPSAPASADPGDGTKGIPIYYGRGFKQLSYYYNYLGFGAAYLGDMKVLLENPDAVAQNGYLAFASGIWFHMTNQAPKPSMHEVITGIYKPQSAAYGIQVNPDGTVKDKFMTSIAVINGIECFDPTTTPIKQSEEKYWGYDKTNSPNKSQANIDKVITQAKNRITYYSALLGYLGVTLTDVERSYATENNGCTVYQDPAQTTFAHSELADPSPVWMYLNWQNKCTAYKQSNGNLLLSSEASWDICPAAATAAGSTTGGL